MRVLTELTMSYIGGMLYVLIEYLWRGRSHPSMFLLGGVCFFLIGSLNRHPLTNTLGFFWQCLLGAAIITLLEFFTGLIVNVALGLAVWDYSSLPLNLMGQICLPYFLLWIPVSALAILTDDTLRFVLFRQPWPHYRLF